MGGPVASAVWCVWVGLWGEVRGQGPREVVELLLVVVVCVGGGGE